MIVVAVFFAFPLLRLLVTSFEGSRLPWYAKALGSNGLYLTILERTFEIAAIVTAGCLVLGYPVAYVLATTTGLPRPTVLSERAKRQAGGR